MFSPATRSCGILLFALLWPGTASATDKVLPKDFYVEPPTLISLGFEWRIDGDDNRNASVAVSYRKRGEQAWKEGLPLLRLGDERINENAFQYIVPRMFAGSIFDLEPDTEYECRFVLTVSVGVDGNTENTVTV